MSKRVAGVFVQELSVARVSGIVCTARLAIYEAGTFHMFGQQVAQSYRRACVRVLVGCGDGLSRFEP